LEQRCNLQSAYTSCTPQNEGVSTKYVAKGYVYPYATMDFRLKMWILSCKRTLIVIGAPQC